MRESGKRAERDKIRWKFVPAIVAFVDSPDVVAHTDELAVPISRQHIFSTDHTHIMLYELIGVVLTLSSLTMSTLRIANTTTGAPRQPSRSPRVRLLLLSRSSHPSNTLLRIAKTTGNIVLNAGGVVRGITNWGVFHLPKPMRKHNATHNTGHYFVVRFDSSARTQHAVRRTLGLDPRMLRYSVVKMGGTLEELRSVVGEVQWNVDPDAKRD